MKTFFSIIVPCCDVAPYIRECLESVINQTFEDWECLVVVETSNDNTEQIVHEITERDKRFKVFTQPRSGSPSAPRNTGLDHACGEYVIFLDGDDSIADGSLARLAELITARPGADLYPCAILAYTGTTNNSHVIDNYPVDKNPPSELSGHDAILFLDKLFCFPEPITQATVYLKSFLAANNLRFIEQLKHEDWEFTPRALYRAKRIVPLHELYYLYRCNRDGSIMFLTRKNGDFLKHFALVYKSLFAFHAVASREIGFDSHISACWARAWISKILICWFSIFYVKQFSRSYRHDTLKILFSNGFDDFDALVKATTIPRRIAAWFVRLFVQHPSWAWVSEQFFMKIYFPLTDMKNKKSKHKSDT